MITFHLTPFSVPKMLLLLLNFSFIYAHNEDIHSVQYNNENFSSELDKKNNFVMFYAPWCGHCQRISPVWEQLAEMLNEDDSNIRIAKVDCTIEKELCTRNDITGYPTLKFFEAGKTDGTKFKGARDLPTLTAFINDQLGTIPSIDEDADDTEASKELNENNFYESVSSGKHFVKFYAPWCGHCEKLAPIWKQLTDNTETKDVHIAKIDCTIHISVCNQYEIQGFPTLLWLENGKKVAEYEGGRSYDELKDYVHKMIGSNDIVGDDKPVNQDDNNSVIVLSEHNFQDGISSGLTFVKFFAPWCGHCKRLAVTWEELGKKFATNSNVHITKVDCTVETSKNICGEQEVDRFPMLILFKDGVKLSEYKGSRSLEDLLEFVSSHLQHDEL